MALSKDKLTGLQINIPIWIDLFQKLGVDNSRIPFLLSQLVFETGYFTADPYKLDNNPAGITWNNNYLKRPGASLGRKRKAVEGGNYVHFDTLENAALDYLRILNRKPGQPITAISIDDFANRLAQNGYYDQRHTSVAQYTTGLKSIYSNIDKTVDVAALLKKKSNVITASAGSIMALLFLGWLYFKK